MKKYAHEWAAVREAQAGRDRFTHEMEQLRGALGRCDEDRRRFEAEASQVKVMLQRELARHQAETATSQQIIADYKQVNLWLPPVMKCEFHRFFFFLLIMFGTWKEIILNHLIYLSV